jgi:hypothetical protein
VDQEFHNELLTFPELHVFQYAEIHNTKVFHFVVSVCFLLRNFFIKHNSKSKYFPAWKITSALLFSRYIFLGKSTEGRPHEVII